jgi:predicted ATPase
MTKASVTESFFVITGGPGAGKTTLVSALEAAGYAVSAEAGRAIILDQVAIGGSALPWGDRALYAELMLAREMQSHRHAASAAGPVIFDRGVPDAMGYLRLTGCGVKDHFAKAAAVFRYNSRVFIAPPWEEIFTQDSERKQDFNEAVRTYESLRDTYLDCGYRLIELPRCPIQERVEFVVGEMKRGSW